MNNKVITVAVLGLLFLIPFLPCVALSPSGEMSEGQDGAFWRIYASYHNATKAVKMGDVAFVLANGDLFSYDNVGAVETYDKASHLSDFGIFDIAYCKAAKKLVVLYNNGNVDLMDAAGDVWNMPELMNKSLQDMTLHHLEFHGKKAYVSIGNNVAEINLTGRNFGNMYEFGEAAMRTQVTDSVICVTTAQHYYVGNVKDNLLDPNKWKELSNTEYQNSNFASLAAENVNDTAALAKAANYIPDSPIRNLSYTMNMVGGKLLVAGGKVSDAQAISETATGMIYENGKWSYLDDSEIVDKEIPKSRFLAATNVVQDPDDATHCFMSTFGTGLYEFRNNKLLKHYTYGNSGLMSILPDNKSCAYYVRISGLNYDPKGNLWMLNNECDTVIKILTKTGTWKPVFSSYIKGAPTMDCTYFDSRNWAWMVNRRTTNTTGASGIFVLDASNVPEKIPSANSGKYLSSFNNQDGTYYLPDRWYCVTEDVAGAMWFGNTAGLFVSYEPDHVFNSNFYLTQIKVNRNDGSGFADYLMNGVAVKCIAVDGANRKWIGSLNDGVYLISADGQKMLEHFTSSNSPLIDDVVNDIKIHPETGEVFIATDKGLCSYMDKSMPADELSSDNIKVYPNPLRPEMPNKITITGLAVSTTVKIVNASGRLVRQGESASGSFTWNCRTDDDKLVSPGVYYILATDSEGNNGATSKFLIVR